MSTVDMVNELAEFAKKIGICVPDSSEDDRYSKSSPPPSCRENTDIESSIHAHMWSVLDDNYVPCQHSTSSLPAGYYTIELNQTRGLFFKKLPINTDNLMRLPDSASDEVINQVDQFWQKEEHYKKTKY